ncbi:hypothetical protein [Helicobacter sp. 11S02629-2]|nr:hypothetical protein [Helicobacter sp. 11S02629-2]
MYTKQETRLGLLESLKSKSARFGKEKVAIIFERKLLLTLKNYNAD